MLTDPDAADPVLQLAEERLVVRKDAIETGRVRIRTVIDESIEHVREVLFSQEAHVERVPIDRDIDHVPQPRWEGDLLIVPVVEEVLVVEKRLRLVEEVRLRVQRFETGVEEAVTLRSERAVIERGRPREGG